MSATTYTDLNGYVNEAVLRQDMRGFFVDLPICAGNNYVARGNRFEASVDVRHGPLRGHIVRTASMVAKRELFLKGMRVRVDANGNATSLRALPIVRVL